MEKQKIQVTEAKVYLHFFFGGGGRRVGGTEHTSDVQGLLLAQ